MSNVNKRKLPSEFDEENPNRGELGVDGEENVGGSKENGAASPSSPFSESSASPSDSPSSSASSSFSNASELNDEGSDDEAERQFAIFPQGGNNEEVFRCFGDLLSTSQCPVDPIFVEGEDTSMTAAEAPVDMHSFEDGNDDLTPSPAKMVAALKSPKPSQQPPLPQSDPTSSDPSRPPLPASPPNSALGPTVDAQLTPDEAKGDDVPSQPCSEQLRPEESEGDSVDEEEIFAMLDENMDGAKGESDDDVVDHEDRIRYWVVEKGNNPFAVLPHGWVRVTHNSGMPIYLHRYNRVATLSRPYYIGKTSARKHRIPITSIPCLNYKKALEEEALQASEEKTEDPSQKQTTPNVLFPPAKVEKAEDSIANSSLSPDEVRTYCQQLFKFKETNFKKFKTWTDRRKFARQIHRKMVQEATSKMATDRPTLPKGTQIITVPVVEMAPTEEGDEANGLNQKIVKKSKKEWICNPAGKSTVCVLHEYLQHSFKKPPVYKYSEVDSALTPYCAIVEINGVEHGKGYGSSKKQAKSEAARLTLEILIPELKGTMKTKKGNILQDPEGVDLSFFDDIRIEDRRVPELCNLTSEPSPYAILVTCLQRNYGLGDTSIVTSLNTGKHKNNIFTMKVNQKEVSVACRNKRDGKQLASQKLLQLLHPHIKSWGSLLRMYGSRAINAQRNKKERELEVTGLQSRKSDNPTPNLAILNKLKEELRLLAERKNAVAPIGKLTLSNPLVDHAHPQDMQPSQEAAMAKIEL